MNSLASLNARGLRSGSKLRAVLAELKRYHFVCLQETWWDKDCAVRAWSLWAGHICYNNGTNKSGGVSILIRDAANSRWREVYSDVAGKVLIVDITCDWLQGRIINVHAPNKEMERKSLFTSLERWITPTTIIIGDLNVVLTSKDRGGREKLKNDCSRPCLMDICFQNNLVDLWRSLNPNKREYSRIEVTNNVCKRSRIDICLVAGNLVNKVVGLNYSANAWSDHSLLTCSFMALGMARGGGIVGFQL